MRDDNRYSERCNGVGIAVGMDSPPRPGGVFVFVLASTFVEGAALVTAGQGSRTELGV